MMAALESAEIGPVHLVLDFGAEEMEVARNVIELDITRASIEPEESEDTASEAQEPVQ
jgi:hypothetical protein